MLLFSPYMHFVQMFGFIVVSGFSDNAARKEISSNC